MKFGKRFSLLVSMILQAGMLAWVAAAGSFNSLIAARCLQGFAAAAAYDFAPSSLFTRQSIVPEIVSDTTFVHRRGAMMSIYIVLISGGSAVGPLIAGFMTSALSDTWHSFMWLCCGVAVFSFLLMFSLFPESNFTRPELDLTIDQLETLHNREAYKEDEAQMPKEELCEEVNQVSSTPDGYNIYTPPLREILSPIAYNAEVNFLNAMIDPLRLLAHPSVCWGIFTYAITLSPQLILIFTMSSLLQAPPYLFSTQDVGLMQIAAIIGFLIACFGGGKLSDIINNFIIRRTAGQNIWPEKRLISLIPGMLFGPAGCILLAFACGNQLSWPAIAVGFGLVSFGSVYTPNIAITYIVHRHQREAAECLVLINIFKNLVAFIFLYVAVEWVNKNGYIQVYMIMFMLNMLILVCAVPLYLYDSRRHRNMDVF
ncbi:hypothetical protein N7462_006564 [Penicillium macrosclerotiorum]|uniref:uncharacterized protein n=1 Tax=Penicillium macrosclerotiorum TaxID=303699 RepID=UPI00254737CF|nr:uncharacterized protein N7462_006564 [Penicillium macrosclerotiorum]KAJ5683399.1 hypothetical protein N7462_006564 [Penicillium macrosclerotiorum]